MLANQDCLFGSIRTCVALRHLHFYVRSPRPAPLLKFKLYYIRGAYIFDLVVHLSFPEVQLCWQIRIACLAA